MGRSSPHTDSEDDNAVVATTSSNNDQQQHPHSIRDQFGFKCNPNHIEDKTQTKPSLHRYLLRHHHVNSMSSVAAASSNPWLNRKGFSSVFPSKGVYLLYFMRLKLINFFLIFNICIFLKIMQLFVSY